MQREDLTAKRKKIGFGIGFILILLLLFVFFIRRPVGGEALTIQGFKLNTVVNISVYDVEDNEILQDAMALCDHYEKVFSRTREDSEIYQLNHGTLPQENGWYVLSDECAELIERGLHYSELSKGAFDITVEPVTELWDFTAESPEVPSKQDIDNAKKKVGYEKVELQGNKIRFAEEGMGIELGAIAKGYIADKIKEFLLSKGVEHAIIDLGGNILCVGERPDGEAFRVGIQKPFAERSETIGNAQIRDRSVVSSGIYERYFEKDGILYHHILNPQTGYPYENELLAVSIISNQSVDGDALSTTCYALGLQKGLELIDKIPEVQAVFVTKDGELHYSQDFEQEVMLTRK